MKKIEKLKNSLKKRMREDGLGKKKMDLEWKMKKNDRKDGWKKIKK